MDVDGAFGIGGDAGANRFEGGSDFGVVEFLPCARIDLEELRADDGAGEIVGDELAELAGFDDVIADFGEASGGGGEVGGDDVAASEAIFDDLDKADVGRGRRPAGSTLRR